MRKPGNKEGYIAKLEDVEAVKKRVEKLEKAIEIRVKEGVRVSESIGVNVPKKQKGFLDRVGEAILEFELKEVTVVLPPFMFKLVRRKKEI